MKKSLIRRRSLMLAVPAALAGFSGTSAACAYEPYISSVCLMGLNWSGMQGYALANGAQLPIAAYTTLFALIGTTYGGDGQTNFKLPDLRGRVVVGAGAGPNLPVYQPGQQGGNVAVTLLPSNVPLPPHIHPLVTGPGGVTVNASAGSLAASAALTGVTAAVSMAGVSASADGSKLSLKGSGGAATAASAAGGALATPAGPANKIYNGSAPDVAMAPGSIAGSAPVSFSGSPTATLSGAPSITLSGSPDVAVGGFTGASGSTPALPVSTMPPYTVMNYYIAVQGIYPNRNN